MGLAAACTTRACAREPLNPGECVICRAARADPFWALHRAAPLLDSGRGIRALTVALDVATLLHLADQPSEWQLHIMSLRKGDAVANRIHWPQRCLIFVNGQFHEVNTGRPLGKHGRGAPVVVPASLLLKSAEGCCAVSLTVPSPAGTAAVPPPEYQFLLAVVRRRTAADVKALMPPPPTLDDALRRVRDCFRTSDACGDCEVAVQALQLRCPLTGSRIRTPARFAGVPGLACVFDLDAFLDAARRTRRWCCPVSLTEGLDVGQLQVDAYAQRILDCLRDLPDVTCVEVAADARWRPAGQQRWLDAAAGEVPFPPSPAARLRHSEGASGGRAAPPGDIIEILD
jgi:MIZ/SP-RING zinc finger